MFQTLPTLLLDGLALAMLIIGIVRLRGVRLNWATLAAILVAMMSAHCIQVAAGLPEQALPILCATLIGPFTLCAMVVSARRAGREKTP
ncbi:hypothetical protein AB8807_07665 [Xanthomonas campestris pv. olitorii]|uniref:Uncharacterized protein n=1 Tax=Xanthomonas campestris pv. malvacearum TaxID=86040 RepID=A0AA45BVA3_XANCM|nr:MULTISPECIES: hypothetical protein [Xanthomonas]WVK05448.1 hypothetical protein KWH09_07655 [Xanthomonas campestris pv. olitorii]AOL18918.1 hypothetical protein BGK55_06415 [Xanthomonas citri pv. malvacearum]ASN00468.1 hypothetical protein APY29_06375 [Xanthomonas citri pv. malvacearum]ASN10398.1 hypothetical protein APY30_15535 [Xanthomonas citri pv. malvacearum]ASY83800.1 hypothetical protein CIW71_06785 [Xanthomonas citri pv. malvacearum]